MAADPYVGEIRMFGGNFAPAGWNFCDGSTLPISQNETLFTLIGTTYGGDGELTFSLPDLRGRVPLHQGNGFTIGQQGGVEEVTLTTQQIPQHTHNLMATSVGGNKATPVGSILANSQGTILPYIQESPDNSLNAGALSHAGGSQPHDNLQPYVAINYIISLFGIYPSQN